MMHKKWPLIPLCNKTKRYKDQLTNPRDALHHGERAVNKYNADAQRDKLATELS